MIKCVNVLFCAALTELHVLHHFVRTLEICLLLRSDYLYF